MGTTLAIVILICTTGAIAAEIMTLVWTDALLSAAAHPERTSLGRRGPVLAVLSIVYIIELGLLLFSGDPLFRTYALIMIVTGGIMWSVRRRVVRYPIVVKLESTVCLILLTDVVYTILKTLGWLSK